MQVLNHAAECQYGVPAFSVNDLEQEQVIMMAAQAADSPVILQALAGARKYAGEAYLRHLVLAASEICKLRFEAFGCAGQAHKIKPIALETMADRYSTA